MSVGIVIPVWNLWSKMTLPCLLSLAKYTNITEIHVYLVDNASTDETKEKAEQIGIQLFSKEHFTYIKNQENLGFAIACNQGAKEAQKAGHEFILFFNNDTIVTENWLPPLVKAMDNPRIGMVGPLLLYPDNTVQHCGVVFTPLSKVKHIYSGFSSQHRCSIKSRKIRIITGAALLCRTHEFFTFGPFYEEYKNGMEDIDLCYSYVRAGKIQQVVPTSIVYHYESQTPGRLDNTIDLKNSQLFCTRNQDIIIDAHIYYAQDGYIPALLKDFTFYACLQNEIKIALNKKIQSNYSDVLCLSMINDEPFWQDGYHLLIQSLQKQKKYKEALQVCDYLLDHCCFSQHNLELAIYLAEQTKDVHCYSEVKELREKQIENKKKLIEVNKNKIIKAFWGTDWYQRLLDTQSLDNTIFGNF